MTAKIHIDVARGVLDVEGDEEFVSGVFDVFKETLLTQFSKTHFEPTLTVSEKASTGSAAEPATVPKTARKKNPPKPKKTPTPIYEPNIVNDMDFDGLQEFVQKFETKNNHAERILVIIKYLEGKGVKPCSADEIYTCYKILKLKLPSNFGQALIDARNKNKYGYISFEKNSEISTTSVGENHFNHDMKQKEITE